MTDEELRAGWPALEPSEGFADRVLATQPAPKRWWLVAAVLLIGIGATLWSRAPASGSVHAQARTSVALGASHAVADLGAQFTWATTWSGELNIEQTAGRTFYRVAPGTPITITTPGGTVSATGPCLTVEVSPMGHSAKWKQPLLAGLAGAALSAAVLVTVYEGEVDLAQANATTQVRAGESGAAAVDVTPRKVSPNSEPAPAVTELEQENARLVAEVAALESAISVKKAGEVDPREVVRLRKAVKDLEAALAQEHVVRSAEEGSPVGFPESLPAAYREDAMRQTFEQVLTEVGIDGKVFAVDCEEFPCIVYGETLHENSTTSSEEMDAMQLRLGERFDRSKHSVHSSVWGNFHAGPNKQENVFGISIYPKDMGDLETDQDNLKKRMRLRQKTFMERYNEDKKQK